MLHNVRFFSLQNAVYLIMPPYLFPVLFAFYLPVGKIRIIQEPNKVALLSKRHFEEK